MDGGSRAEVVAGAGEVLAETGVADRCEVVPTDFFHSVVPGGDAYVLAQILHNWPDEKCVEIMRKCADTMEYGARLWVIEKVARMTWRPPRWKSPCSTSTCSFASGRESERETNTFSCSRGPDLPT
jgi:hypothetical protein